jgi:hypothetical protein
LCGRPAASRGRRPPCVSPLPAAPPIVLPISFSARLPNATHPPSLRFYPLGKLTVAARNRVYLWTAPGPKISRVYAYLASRRLMRREGSRPARDDLTANRAHPPWLGNVERRRRLSGTVTDLEQACRIGFPPRWPSGTADRWPTELRAERSRHPHPAADRPLSPANAVAGLLRPGRSGRSGTRSVQWYRHLLASGAGGPAVLAG